MVWWSVAWCGGGVVRLVAWVPRPQSSVHIKNGIFAGGCAG